MDFTTGSEKEVLDQWSFKVTVEFVDLPPEKEEAFRETLRYFANVMFQEEAPK